jgi:hypothetical protein
MKVTIFAISWIIGVISLSQESAAVTPKHRFSQSSALNYKHHAVENRPPTIGPKPDITGVIPRVIRGSNPLQMLNPFAPAKYGTAEENTVFDPDIPKRGDGIKLLSVSF